VVVRDDGAMFPAGLITAVDHIGIAVPDLDEAIAFYAESFGFEVVHREANEGQDVREAMLAVGDSGVCLQLLAPLGPDSAITRFLERKGPGVQQVAYRVTSIEDAMAAVRAQGMRLLYDEPRRGTANSRINFIHPKDAGGVLVELVQPAPPGPTTAEPASSGR
jgi:methylmalonyl-CoA/ethylmalonyl-CoA epimerase